MKVKSANGAILESILFEYQTLSLHYLLSLVYTRGFAPHFVNSTKGALDWQPQVKKFTSCLPMVGGSLRVLWLLPPLKLDYSVEL
jgi:hypothetical protein